ncbi:MAG TPA: NUDIX domain-containing protein [Alphaproteobacteria bacterium]|nr:NUDIX domain-containing protein [Alphaproteobacteria bacterium]
MSEPRKVELLSRETVFQGHYRVDRYRLRHSQFAGGLGPEISREVFERGHAVAVLPYDPVRDEVVLLEQFRVAPYACGDEAWMLEIVAGLTEPGEALEDVARRETQEEAGLALQALKPVARYYTSPGAVTEHVTVYAGRVDAAGAGGIHGLDHEGEDIRVTVVPASEALEMLEAGRFRNSPALIAMQWFALNREALRREWRA